MVLLSSRRVDHNTPLAQRAAVPKRRHPPRTLLALATLASLGGCLGLDPLSAQANDRLRTFDFYWQQLADDYPLFGPRPIDWNELRRRYRAAVPFTRAPHEFYHLLTGMLSELADVHVSLSIPPERMAIADLAATSLLDVDGFRVMPIEGRLHVVGWPLGHAPMPPEVLTNGDNHPELWRVEGFPVVLSLVGNLFLGPPDSPVELQLRWRDGSITRHVLRRPVGTSGQARSPLGHLRPDPRGFRLRQSQPFCWLAVDDFDQDLPIEKLEAIVDRARASDGLVLDLRNNLGGLFANAQRLAERFLQSRVPLVFAPPHPESRWFGLVTVEWFMQDEWQPREPRFDRPLVVLTSAMTGSAAEHTARILQRHAGAIVVGERTAGAEAVVQEAEGPDGGTLRFGSTRVLESNGVGLQEEGVVPDVSVRLRIEDVEMLGPDGAVVEWETRIAAAARAALDRLARARGSGR